MISLGIIAARRRAGGGGGGISSAAGTSSAVALAAGITEGIAESVGSASAIGVADGFSPEPVSIEYVGGSSFNCPWNTTSNLSCSLTGLTGGLDSEPADGDLVVVAYGQQGGDVNMQVATAGYTEVCDLRAADAAANNFSVFYKVMSGTPDTTVDVVRQNFGTPGRVIVQVFRNVDPTTPMDVTAVTGTSAADGQPDPGAITPVTAGAWVLAAGSGAWNTFSAFTSSDLSDFLSDFSNGTFDMAVGIGHFEWTSGAFDPAKWGGGSTSSTACNTWCTMALRPATP